VPSFVETLEPRANAATVVDPIESTDKDREPMTGQRVYISSCSCVPPAECYVDSWIAQLTSAGHTVVHYAGFAGYTTIYETIAASDVVLGLVTFANGTQWAVELSAAVGPWPSRVNDEIAYEGEAKPTYLQWVGEGTPFSFFESLIEHGAVRLPANHDAAVSTLLRALED
jgi:hypothetical protein